MFEWPKFLPGLAAAAVYAGLIVRKLTKGGNSVPLIRRILTFDVIRLFLDGILLTGFLISRLCPAWFGLFPENAPGFCAGCLGLIGSTLLISIFTDWIPIYRSGRQAGSKPLTFARYLLMQLANLTGVLFGLALIWCVFLLLEPTGAGLPVQIACAAGILLLLRIILRLAQGSKHKAE